MSAAKCETGWGDGLSSRTAPRLRDHPTPAASRRAQERASLVSPPPGEGKSRARLQLEHTFAFSRRNPPELYM
jgi:osmoprotectant transport system ATP-binding protein